MIYFSSLTRRMLLMQILDCGTRSLKIESACRMARYFVSSVHTEVPLPALQTTRSRSHHPFYTRAKTFFGSTHGPSSAQICLFYSITEFEDVLARFCRGSGIEFTLKKDLRNYIFAITNGHPGMVRSILVFIEEVRDLHIMLDQRLLTLIAVLLSSSETHWCTRNSSWQHSPCPRRW